MAFVGIEFGLMAMAMACAFAWPGLGAGWFARVERIFARLARRKGFAAATVGVSAVVLRLALLPLFPIPLPFVPDDFSFLLACDTFAHGRLANPTPAMWTHFESIHITMQPTYQSMYFPGQGLLLAAGQRLLGHPWFGLLAAAGLLCGVLTWMLQAWLPPNWALLGGIIAVIRLGLFSDWINTYHTAGTLAALGGALMLGALPRLVKTARLRYGLLMSVGVVLVGLTRPYEGVLLCVPVAVMLGHWMWKGKNRRRAVLQARRAALPAALLVCAGAWMGYYDLKAFGKATTLPYTINRDTYAIVPYYFWQHVRPAPVYRSEDLRIFYEKEEMDFYNKIHSVKGFLPFTLAKAGMALLFYAGPALLPPLIMLRRLFLDRRIRFLVICSLVLMAGMIIEIYLMPYYVAPFTAAFYALGLQAMRHMRVWRPEGMPMGITAVRFLVFLCVALCGVRIFAKPLHVSPPEWPPSNWNLSWIGPEHFGTERAQVEAQLSKLPGGQLAIVRYAPGHHPIDEWVYNGADIDHAKVIWARDMGPAEDLELIRYYRDRSVWLIEPDQSEAGANPAGVSPYPFEESME
jgi:hypothetical protein